MVANHSKTLWLQIISIAIVSAGFGQLSYAGQIDTSYLIEAGDRTASLDRIQALLAADSVADQLQNFGVEQSAIHKRLQGLTTAELVALESELQTQVAGGDIVATLGIVFIVLLILELLGATDIFKSI